mgnify:CR=1 FL=1
MTKLNKKKKKAIIIISIIVLSLFCVIMAFYLSIFGKVLTNEKAEYIYIDNDDNIDSVKTKIEALGKPTSMLGFNLLNDYTDYEKSIKIGRYKVSEDMTMLSLFRNIRNGQQTPVSVVVPSVRTTSEVCDKIARYLMLDSEDLKVLINDSIFIRELGFTKETIPALFIPNTYEIYWTTEPKQLLERLKKEYDDFWNEDRLSKAKEIGLTPNEVTTLASIVDSETARDQDKPIIARLYLNRLAIKMKLASDPTVVFALGDFSLRRVLRKHLDIDSPYNTYKNEGLPPGPIRIATIAGIDAVLNPDDNDYLYMCAKEDFSGEHYYTASASEHEKNAKKYADALNKRGIK